MEGSSEKSQLNQLWSLFCEVRENLDDASTIFLKKTIPLGADQQEMLKAQFSGVLMWLSKIISFLIKQKQQLEQIIEKKNASECSDYEQALQKLEAEVRQHIRVQQQMKLYTESTQEKLEQTTKERGLFEEKVKELEKKLLISAQDYFNKEEEIAKLKRQLTIKMEQADNTEETIRVLTKQLHQLQGQYNPIQPQEFITKPLDKQNYQQSVLMQAQQNESSRCFNSDAQKKQIRSISSMNEELSKKYIQLGGQQSLFSTSSHITAPSDNSSKSNAFSEFSHLRTYTEPPTQERSNSRQGEIMNENKKYLEKSSPNHPERKNQQTRYYSIETGSKNKLPTNTTSSCQATTLSTLQNNIQTSYSQAYDHTKEAVGQVAAKQKPINQINSGQQSQEITQNNSLIQNSQYSKSDLPQNSSNKVVNITSLTSKIKNMNNYQYPIGNSSQITQNSNYGFYQDQQMNYNLEQIQGFSQNQSIDAQNNNGFQQRQLASTSIGSHFRNSSNQQNGTSYDKTQVKNPQRYPFKTYQNQESPSKSVSKNNGNTQTQLITQKSVYEAESNKSQRTYLNVNKGNSTSHQNNSKDQRANTVIVPTFQTHTNIGSQLKTQVNGSISQINQQNNANNSKGIQFISSQKSSSSLEKINPCYPSQPPKSLQATGQNGAAIGQAISIFPSSSNGLGPVSQQNKITNPRSQSMDEFSKGSTEAKQGNQQNYIQNSYLKQKTSQQVQTSEIINNLMKSFKLH